jgi:DNA modification methylase
MPARKKLMPEQQSPSPMQNRIVGDAEVDPRELTANPANWRVHSVEQCTAMRGILEEVGWVQRVIVNRRTGHLLDGHMRVANAIEAKLATVPVTYVDVSESEEALVIATLDRIGTHATMDNEKLKALLDQVDPANPAAKQFVDEELARLLANVELAPGPEFIEPEGDAGAESHGPPVTVQGDRWQLGPHRVMCGDCRDGEQMHALMGAEQIAIAVTSPPYAAQRDYDEASGFQPIEPDEYVAWFRNVAGNIATHLAPDGSFFLNIKEHCEEGERVLYVKDLTLAHAREWGWHFIDEFAWTHGGTPKAVVRRFKNGWEPIFQFSRNRNFKFRPDAVMHATDSIPDWQGMHPSQLDSLIAQGGVNVSSAQGARGMGTKIQQAIGARAAQRKYAVLREGNGGLHGDGIQGSGETAGGFVPEDGMAYPSNVLSLGKNREALGHSAAFPLGLPEFFLKAYSDAGDVVFDPFLGSGTTLIAAAHLGRRCYAMELSPQYVDIAIRRFMRALPDVPVTVEGSGASFLEVERSRTGI